MDDIPTIAINHRKEIIPAPTLDFEIGKVGLQHIIGEFSLMMELIGCKDKIMFCDLCKTYHPLNFLPYTLRRMNIFDQKMPLEVIFE